MREPSVLDDPAFQSAFVAVGYLLGVPAEQRTPFDAPAEAALGLARELESGERPVRARALASELERVGRRLDARRLA